MTTKPKLVKFQVDDIKGFHWEKQGDFGLLAVGNSQTGNVEVDFTATNNEQISVTIATALLIASKEIPNILERVIFLYNSQNKTGGKE